MSIKKICKNCIFNDEHYAPFNLVCNYHETVQNCFAPKEDLVRADENSKLIEILKEDYKTAKNNYDGYKDANYEKGYWAGQMDFANNLICLLFANNLICLLKESK